MIYRLQREIVLMTKQLVPGTAMIKTMALVSWAWPCPIVTPPVHDGPAGHDLPSFLGSTFQFAHLDDIQYIGDSNISVLLFLGNPSIVSGDFSEQWPQEATAFPKLVSGMSVQKPPLTTGLCPGLQMPVLRPDLSQVLVVSRGTREEKRAFL